MIARNLLVPVADSSQQGVLPEEEVCIAGEVMPFEEVEKRVIKRALRLCNWDVITTARRLQIGEATIYRKLKQHQIPLPVRPRVRRPVVFSAF